MKKGHKAKKHPVKVPKINGLGAVDFQFELALPEEAMEFYKIDWDKIQKISDLQFLKDNKDIWDRIQLSTNNYVVNLLLYLNKPQLSRIFVDFIVYAGPQYSEDEAFMKEIVTYVTEHNFLFVNEANLCQYPVKMTFTLKIGKTSKCFVLCKSGNESQNEKPNVNQSPYQSEYQQSSVEAEHKNDEKKEEEKKSNPYAKINTVFSDVDYFYIDLEDILDLQKEGKLMIEDLKQYLEQLKLSYGTGIIVNYPNITERVNEINAEGMQSLTNIMFLTDIFIFEKKEAYSLFNMLYHFHSNEGTIKNLDEKKYIDYFVNEIAYGGVISRKYSKIGMFLEDFQKMTFVEVASLGDVFQCEYDAQIYPKVNHTNQKLVEEYKGLINREYGTYKSIFFGAMLGRIAHCKTHKKGINTLYPAFLTGLESAKRIVELNKNEIEVPADPDFYIVVLPNSKIGKEVDTQILKKKEDMFFLDCRNKNTSSLKYYNPLFDGHLNSFFASDFIRKELKTKGFINTNGFIMYDPVYRSCMGSSPKKRRGSLDFDKDKKLLYIIKGIRVAENPSSKEVESLAKMRNSNSPTNRKLPIMSLEYVCKSQQVKGKAKAKLKPIKNMKTEADELKEYTNSFEKV